jgi:hypothetical protein
MAKKLVRLGGGSAGAEDRLDPALELIEKGGVDYVGFDSLSEAELSIIGRKKSLDPSAPGYDEFAGRRLRTMLPMAVANGVKIISNLGALDPPSAQDLALRIATEESLRGVRVAAVTGDNVLDRVRALNLKAVETGLGASHYGDRLISAHAYVPADVIVEALSDGAQVVITGRIGDASLFLGPLLYEFDWDSSDWDKRARGLVAGHLLECGAQVTGGYFADPPYKVVPDLHRLGFPIAEVSDDGEIVITKVDGSGGLVSPATCREQLLYEVHDPSRYLTADVVADFHDADFEQLGPDRVGLCGVVNGHPGAEQLKVSLGVAEGYLGSSTVFYGGPGARSRAELAADEVRARIEYLGLQPDRLSVSLLGLDSMYGTTVAGDAAEPWEVGLRVAAQAMSEEDVVTVVREASTVLSNNGPAGVSCRARQYEIREVVGYYHTFISRDEISVNVTVKGN